MERTASKNNQLKVQKYSSSLNSRNPETVTCFVQDDSSKYLRISLQNKSCLDCSLIFFAVNKMLIEKDLRLGLKEANVSLGREEPVR